MKKRHLFKRMSNKKLALQKAIYSIDYGIYSRFTSDGEASLWEGHYGRMRDYYFLLLNTELQILEFVSKGQFRFSREIVTTSGDSQRVNKEVRLLRMQELIRILKFVDKINVNFAGVNSFLYSLKEKLFEADEEVDLKVIYKLISLTDFKNPNKRDITNLFLLLDTLEERIHAFVESNIDKFNHYSRVSSKKLQGLQNYVDSIFHENPRQFIFRSVLLPGFNEVSASYEDVISFLLRVKSFFSEIRKHSWFDNVNGYVWRLESTVDGFYSVQVIWFFKNEFCRDSDMKCEYGIEQSWIQTKKDQERKILGFYAVLGSNRISVDAEAVYEKLKQVVKSSKDQALCFSGFTKGGMINEILQIINGHQDSIIDNRNLRYQERKTYYQEVVNHMNLNKSQQECLIGYQDYQNSDFRQALKRLLEYFSKIDCFISINVPMKDNLKGKVRTFGRGEIKTKQGG